MSGPNWEAHRAWQLERHSERPLDLGHGVRASFWVFADTEQRGGIIFSHTKDDGSFCCNGTVNFNVPGNEQRATWQLVSMDPLHVEPSVLQPECGLHGFIREGRWFPT